ncbi:hypothetical protein BRETT_003788 [Brettanomyces bruxellensis]|uniref:CREG-like beta-barrel domain-containing protein n=1 Tax=Dekkera bruxellensis TaxID=5007 RepID=A0A871R029_DEKBR|nr:uncharacterized protein BRETT_003788 [Brettanomyces bruxellensis]QOU19637.1 hypothetical protein BRETT_003788 [Brettanomyces bruxellensis]
MKFATALLLLANTRYIAGLPAGCYDQNIEEIGHGYHDVETAARVARTLVSRESLANLNTYDTNTGYPVGFVEYYADCQQDGEPVMLMIGISSSNKNIAAGSNASLTIRVGDHQPGDRVDPHYIGKVPHSVAGSPRLNLKGQFINYKPTHSEQEYFVSRHHEAISWFPGNPIHDSYWVKFKVESIYFVGGFGDRAYIGEIPAEMYLTAKPFPSRKIPRRSIGSHENDNHGSIADSISSIVDRLHIALFGTSPDEYLSESIDQKHDDPQTSEHMIVDQTNEV